MSFNLEAGSSSGPPPSWAQQANQPLVPFVDVQDIKKRVHHDLKEIKKASDELGKLAKKKGAKNSAPKMLALSSSARERARGTSRTIRAAFGTCPEGTPEHAVLVQLSEEFKATLQHFQQQAEAAAPEPQQPQLGYNGASGAGVSDMPTTAAGGADMEAATAQTAQQLQEVAANDQVIAERETGIMNINRTVQEVSEIFQDLALLVSEQGEHIDNIQTNIESAAKHTAKGVKELASASKKQKKMRGRICMLLVCVMVLLLVGFLVLKFGVSAFRR